MTIIRAMMEYTAAAREMISMITTPAATADALPLATVAAVTINMITAAAVRIIFAIR